MHRYRGLVVAGYVVVGLRALTGIAAAQSLGAAAKLPSGAPSAMSSVTSSGTSTVSSVVAPAIVATAVAAATPAVENLPAPSIVNIPVPTAAASLAAPPAPPAAGVQTAALVAPIPHVDETAAGQKLYDQTRDGSRDDPMSWSLHVFKSRHRTEVFFKGHLLRVYHAVFGRSRDGGGKQWEGDSRTPEGAYLIIEKRRSARFNWFLKLSYPNAADQARFAELRSTHEISARAREGGQIGIHGTDSPYLNVSDVNWTLGCISIDNRDIDEMARLLPVGTLVVINP